MKRNIEQDGDAVIMDAGNLAGVGSNGSTMVQGVQQRRIAPESAR